MAAAAALTVGVSHFMMPRAQLHFATGVTPAFFESLAAGSGVFRVHYWAFVVAALAFTGVVVGCRMLLPEPRPLSYRIAEVWGLVGLAVAAIDFALMQSKALGIAAAFGGLDASARSAVVATGLPRLDPTGLFSFGLVGVWLVSFSSGVRRTLGLALPCLGTIGTILYWWVFLGTLLHQPLLVDIGAGLGGAVVAPIWSVWLGTKLLRMRENAPSQSPNC